MVAVAVAVGHIHAIPGRGAAEEVAVGIDHPGVGSRTGNRTKSAGHQGADHKEAELGPGMAKVDRSLLRTGLPMQVEVHHDVGCLAHPWCRRRNR